MYHLHADVLTLFSGIPGKEMEVVNQHLTTLSVWIKAKKLKLNLGKTEVLLLYSHFGRIKFIASNSILSLHTHILCRIIHSLGCSAQCERSRCSNPYPDKRFIRLMLHAMYTAWKQPKLFGPKMMQSERWIYLDNKSIFCKFYKVLFQLQFMLLALTHKVLTNIFFPSYYQSFPKINIRGPPLGAFPAWDIGISHWRENYSSS